MPIAIDFYILQIGILHAEKKAQYFTLSQNAVSTLMVSCIRKSWSCVFQRIIPVHLWSQIYSIKELYDFNHSFKSVKVKNLPSWIFFPTWKEKLLSHGYIETITKDVSVNILGCCMSDLTHSSMKNPLCPFRGTAFSSTFLLLNNCMVLLKRHLNWMSN